MYLFDPAQQVDAGESVNVDVHHLPGVDVVDIGFIDTGRDVHLRKVVGHSQRCSSRDESALDTIVDATPETLAAGTANGFAFYHYSSHELEAKLRRVCDTYRFDQHTWGQLVDNGMRQDWSWTNSARQYVDLYAQTLERKKHRPVAR